MACVHRIGLVDAAATHIPVYRRLGASLCKLHLDVRYWDQCNLEFSPEQVGRIAALGVLFTISCWDYSGQEEPAAPGTLGEPK